MSRVDYADRGEAPVKAEPNRYGVTWAASRSGRWNIAVAGEGTCWTVWTIRTGTHDIGFTRSFADEASARKLANDTWRDS